MARIMTRRKAIPKAIELLQCLPQTEEVVEVIQALKNILLRHWIDGMQPVYMKH